MSPAAAWFFKIIQQFRPEEKGGKDPGVVEAPQHYRHRG